MRRPASADGPHRRAVALGLGAGLIAPRAWAAAGAAAPVVHTNGGAVRGYAEDGARVFKGIPYGADTGPARFQPPRPAPPWDGVRDALAYGPSAPQS